MKLTATIAHLRQKKKNPHDYNMYKCPLYGHKKDAPGYTPRGEFRFCA